MNKNKNKFMFTAAVFALLNLFLGAALCSVSYRIEAAENNIQEIKKDIYVYERRIKSVKDIEKALNENKEESRQIEEVFINKDSVVDFIKELEYLAGQTGVGLELKNVILADERQMESVFSLATVGSFDSLFRFLFLLENDKYQMAFDKVYFQKTEKEKDWTGNFEINLLSYEI